MLGGEPILTRDGGTLTDGHGHHPYVTTRRLRAVAGQARADGLPARRGGHRSATSSPCRTWRSSTRSSSARSTPRRCSTRRTSGCADMAERPGLREAGPGLLERGRAHRGRAVRRRPVRRLHDEPARGVRGRARRAGHRGDRRRGRGADASATPTRSSSCARRWPSAPPRRRWSQAEASTFGPADVAREIAAVVRAHEADGHRPRPGPARQRRRGQRRLPGRRSGSPTSSAARSSTAPSVVSVADGTVIARVEGPDGIETYRGAAAGRRHDPRGRRRAALPERARPDEGQEGRGRGALAVGRALRRQAGEAHAARRRCRATCRSWARAPTAAPAVVDVLEELGVLSR